MSAEILSLQAELVAVMVANRARAARVLHAVLQDVPRQLEDARERQRGAEATQSFVVAVREAKRMQKKLKREEAIRAAQAAAEKAVHGSNRRFVRGGDVEGPKEGPETWRERFKLGEHFVDMLAKRMTEVREWWRY